MNALELVDGRVCILIGDVRGRLRDLPAGSVHCVVTSPPYWGLRDYGTGAWEGGDAACDHTRKPGGTGGDPKYGANKGNAGGAPTPMGDTCVYCGARRVDQQLGLEATPDEYVAAMVDVFREVRRVLRDDGTVWLNLGDSYATDGGRGAARMGQLGKPLTGLTSAIARGSAPGTKVGSGLKEKDLCGIPWRVAFALQQDGWWLRAETIWHKPNPMPESVTDRPTRAHEQLFLLTKSARYYYDADAVREPHHPDGRQATKIASNGAGVTTHANYANHQGAERWPGSGRNLRSVWTITTDPYPDAHFATYPAALVEPCVKAGTSERGVCPDCGAPWERATERQNESTYARIQREHGITYKDMKAEAEANGITPGNVGGTHAPGKRGATYDPPQNRTTGWRPTCAHYDALYHRDFPKPRGRWQRMTWWARVTARPVPPELGWPTVAASVLDPFLGSGTTAVVALRLGRNAIGVELSAEYAALAEKRIARWWEKPARTRGEQDDAQLDLFAGGLT